MHLFILDPLSQQGMGGAVSGCGVLSNGDVEFCQDEGKGVALAGGAAQRTTGLSDYAINLLAENGMARTAFALVSCQHLRGFTR
jgi:hypothetical protein